MFTRRVATIKAVRAIVHDLEKPDKALQIFNDLAAGKAWAKRGGLPGRPIIRPVRRSAPVISSSTAQGIARTASQDKRAE